jgi:hypothetical protein
MSTLYETMSSEKADQASRNTGGIQQTDAIGEGLAAVAYALLDVAQAIRELAQAQERP